MDIQEHFYRYYPSVCRHVTYILGDSGLAEDIAQEAFLKLYQSPPDNRSAVGGWLFRVAKNLAINLIRSEKSRSQRELKVQEERYGEVSSEETVIRKEEAAMIHQVLNAMGERDRTCLIMKFSGFSYEEIARATGTKKSSMGTIIARAQAKFRERVLELKGSDPDVF
ncbi:MAG: RNA polymerase sigma factor SigX [Peptococcaceae bacterium BICA1-7]|nr:MAG: RNA polymerase sigma factor SigX [Peptococcaceae bacterium BICA1-7]